MPNATDSRDIVAVPRARLDPTRALGLLGRRAGRRYVVLQPCLGGVVGPFKPGAELVADDLLQSIADATGTELTRSGDVPVLQAPATERLDAALTDITSDDPARRRAAAYALGQSRRLEAVSPLMTAVGDPDESVRRAALLALEGLEGDFDTNAWPGRLSVFELPEVPVDSETLMWLAEEGAEPGSTPWQAAVSVLGRARDGQLSRSLWWNIWKRQPGAVPVSVRALGRCGDRDMRGPVRQIFSQPGDAGEPGRFEAAAALGKLREIRRLVTAAADPDNIPALKRCAAAYGLGFCPTTEAVDALGNLLDDPDARVRQLAALSLGRIGLPAAIRQLDETVRNKQADLASRAAAVRVLGRANDTTDFDTIAYASSSAEPALRAAAADALAERGGAEAADRLLPMLDDAAPDVVAAAARALGALGPGRGFERVAALLTQHDRLDVRIAATVGLGQSRAPEAEPPLRRVAEDPDAQLRLRMYATRSLAVLVDRAGQDTLRRLIDADSPLQVRLLALRTLDLGDPKETAAVLTWWATHGKPRHEQAAAYERLAQLGTPEGTRFLAGGFDTFDNYTRWACIWPLICSHDPAVQAALLDLLRSRRSGVRMNAAIALGGRQDPAVVDALIEACRDPHRNVRLAAALSLGACDDPRAAAALLRLATEDDDLAVAHHAVRALRAPELAARHDVRTALARLSNTRRDCGVPASAPSVLDQPANSWVLRRSARTYDDLRLPNLSYESALCFDDATRRVVQWGSHGRRYDSPQTGLTWLYDTGANEWIRPLPRQEPPGTCMTRGLANDAARGLVFSPKSATGMGGHGWLMYLRKFASFSSPWAFDTRSREWFPVRPPAGPGSCGQATTCFDRQNDVMIVVHRGIQVYDPHTNTWTSMDPPGPAPEVGGVRPTAYDPVTARLIVVAGTDARGRGRTWAYDLRENRWEELKPSNPPPDLGSSPMVYDRANGVMLAFRPEPGRVAVYAYYPRENRWEPLPVAHPCPSYKLFDATYDPVHNVTVVCGGEQASCSGAITARETWTYRYRPATLRAWPAVAPPSNLRIDLSEAGAVSLAWDPPPGDLRGYQVYRGAGEHPWTAVVEQMVELPPDATSFTEPESLDNQPRYYHVRAVGADGKESAPSNLVRIRPAPVREVSAARRADGGAALSWSPSPGPAVMGYNVYRAPVEPLDLWAEHFDPGTRAGVFVKVNESAVEETSFLDNPDTEVRPGDEAHWAPLFAYVVRAVNALGIESGPSPATLSIPGPPGPVLVLPQEDGRRLVISGASESKPLAGYHLYRLDCYRGDLVFRFRGAAQPGAVFVDDENWPTGHRRAYYVVPEDELGQLGVSSSPGWGHEMP
jgi:HEAT repeat protein